jgi:hypothetical protein
MTDRRDWLVAFDEVFHECYGLLIHAQPIGIHHATRQNQGVIPVGIDAIERSIHGHRVAPLLVLPGFYFSGIRGNDFGSCTCGVQGFAGLEKLILLKAVCRKNCDTQSFQFRRHATSHSVTFEILNFSFVMLCGVTALESS